MLTIGVVAYNNADEIIAFAEHLRTLPLPEHELRIWDNSEDESVLRALADREELGRFEGGEGNLGFGAGHNRIYDSSDGPLYLVSNADVTYTPECIPTLIECLEREEHAGLVAPRLLNEDGSLQLSCRTFYTPFLAAVRRPPLRWLYPDDHRLIRAHLMADADHTQTLSVDWVLGAVLLVRRAAVCRPSLFDPRYFLYFEDVDLCRHVADSGSDVCYCGEAVATHAHRRSSARGLFGRSSRWHAASMMRYFWKHRGRRRIASHRF
ncbi:MAG: glycosyltransferase family 2 protein [Phycisphaerales bacterium]|nr:glycosyltransferase family 2 protein [Phycisphaerales bacterium]